MADGKKGLLASLGELFGQAVDSARHEVVERGWFGREVTGDTPASTEPMAVEPTPLWRPQSFEEQWAARDDMALKAAEHEHGQDIDR